MSRINLLPAQPGLLIYDAAFIAPAESNALLADLLATTPWQQENIMMYGRELPVPRLISWHGDRDYTYSHTRHIASPWTPLLRDLQQRVEAAAKTPFNSVLLNLYRDGRDSVSWHADDESDLGQAPVIASLSLGAARDFKLRPKAKLPDRQSIGITLTHGSLLIMGAGLQQTWEHAVPKTAKPVGPRVNLTFRYLG